MEYANKIESLKQLIREAAWSAKECHEVLFRDDSTVNNKNDEIIAAIYLSKAISLMTSAKAVYISDYENLAHNEVENIFTEFSLFEDEFLKSMKTGHVHQWTNINFKRFKDAYEELLGEL